MLETTNSAGNVVRSRLGGVHLRLLNHKGKVVRATLSDRNGDFVFKNVKPNRDNELYTIKARSKHYTQLNMLTVGIDVNKGELKKIGEIRFRQ